MNGQKKTALNNDNKIVVYSSWTQKNLFFGIIVKDKSIISHFDPNPEKIIPREDGIEIFLDTDHNHYEILSLPDRHFLLSASGMIYENIRYIAENYAQELDYNPPVKYKVNVEGTINDEGNIDTGYTIEIAISWEELGVNPEDIKSMGLEIFNIDKDYTNANHFYSGWSTIAPNLQNPSEWGNIVFIVDSNFYHNSIAVVIAIICSTVFFLIILRKRIYRSEREEVAAIDKTPDISERDIIKKAKNYIFENYYKETLTRDEVAQFVCLAPSYFSTIFKKETGCNFTDYLSIIRIEKAKVLLFSTRKNISEIAYEVGFSSQSYFGHVFKLKEKKSPKEFRLHHYLSLP